MKKDSVRIIKLSVKIRKIISKRNTCGLDCIILLLEDRTKHAPLDRLILRSLVWLLHHHAEQIVSFVLVRGSSGREPGIAGRSPALGWRHVGRSHPEVVIRGPLRPIRIRTEPAPPSVPSKRFTDIL